MAKTINPQVRMTIDFDADAYEYLTRAAKAHGFRYPGQFAKYIVTSTMARMRQAERLAQLNTDPESFRRGTKQDAKRWDTESADVAIAGVPSPTNES